MKIFVLQKNESDILHHPAYYFNFQKVMWFYYNDNQCPSKIKNTFTHNEPVNRYNTRGEKLLFIPWVNLTHYGTKSLRYNGLVIWNNLSRNISNNNNF